MQGQRHVSPTEIGRRARAPIIEDSFKGTNSYFGQFS